MMMITGSNNQICFMLRAGNYGRINHPDKPYHAKQKAVEENSPTA
jgi:hypothetical protein